MSTPPSGANGARHIIPDGALGLPYARAWNDGRRYGVTCPTCGANFGATIASASRPNAPKPGYLYAKHYTTEAAQGR